MRHLSPYPRPLLFVPLMAALLLTLATLGVAGPVTTGPGQPDVILITVDTLRSDRLSAYGYEQNTSPRIDALIAAGARFAEARTVEPLTSPALSSMLTSLYPHKHGSSRNGLRVRPGLESLPRSLEQRGYRTGAFISNWTLRNKLSGLGEHFENYSEVLTRKRWFGLVRSEATGEDVTTEALKWVDRVRAEGGTKPMVLWAHYSEPHAPYLAHNEYRDRLGLAPTGDLTKSERYDMEIAYVDHWVGELLDGLESRGSGRQRVIVFAGDHGESLGEHDYWGHGRNLYEPTLRIPMSITWTGHVPDGRTIETAALNVDLAPTILGMLGHEIPESFSGYDWTAVLGGSVAEPVDRVTYFEAHRGAVVSKHDSDLARRSGLISVGWVRGPVKEIFGVEKGRFMSFDLAADPAETVNLNENGDPPEGLLTWMRSVFDGLSAFEDLPPEPLDEESVEALRSLGYVGD